MFDPVPTKYDFPEAERETLALWKRERIFEKSIERREGAPEFVFYEGPPTANGRPHPGHVLTRVVKDIFLRYKTMCGFRVPRKAGWDTHGLPVEIEVEKELGLKNKAEVLAFGIDRFIDRCRQSVWRYQEEWERLTERIGYWLDLSDPYVTYAKEYIESVWWAIAEIHKKDLLYRGHKILPYCPRCGTGLSSHEVAQGYREVADVSCFVRFRVKGEKGTSFLAWTTTPWTLLSNVALAVAPDETYAYVETGGETLILAQALADGVLGERERTLTKTVKGRDLVGTDYEPLFTFAKIDKRAHYVVAGDFVTLTEGTGVVHVAPAFGEEDYRIGVENDLPFVQLVRADGCLPDEIAPWAGLFVKDADAHILRELDDRGLLFARGTYTHSYPFCWRCDSPLIYYARASWYIRTTAVKEKLLANNAAVHWVPEHIREGRYGDWLKNNIDWAISRERYWGTPLPIWVCETCDAERAVASVAELREISPDVPEALDPHKPGIDAVTFPCAAEGCGGTMRRTPEVVDCWFDSGCMPFAQWGHPHAEGERFGRAFPCDFISEAIDQTRGWFYTLMAVSTMLMDAPWPHPYRTCLVLGHVCDEKGRKMSKSLGNYLDPQLILDENGADALRWYFYSTIPSWAPVRFFREGVASAQREFLLKLWNVYSFFVIYANIDGFDPAAGADGKRPAAERTLLDRWILSELALTAERVREHLDAYAIYPAARALYDFVDALSNWYVRRSRARFWGPGLTPDKLDAYWTLYECLTTLTRLAAPFVPFVTERLWANLVRGRLADAPESVHLADFPEPDAAALDRELAGWMDLARSVASLGRAARARARVPTRQPLARAVVVLAHPELRRAVEPHADLIREELNVKDVEFRDEADEFVRYEVRPNFKVLGPKHGRRMPALKAALEAADAGAVRRAIEADSPFAVEADGARIDLTREELEVQLAAREGFSAADSPRAVVVLDVSVGPELRAEGLARELVHAVQNARKDGKLAYEARIATTVTAEASAGAELLAAARKHAGHVAGETLTAPDRLVLSEGDPEAAPGRRVKVGGVPCAVEIEVID